MARICVIDDDALMRDSLRETLSREDHEVTAYPEPIESLGKIRGGEYDLVLCDLRMPRMDGVSFIRHLRAHECDVPVILMTAFATVPTAVEALKLGAYDYIQKPFELDAISVQIDRALRAARLMKDNEALKTSLNDFAPPREMIGGSGAMRQIREQIERVASSDATVLISGESGTGKELVARAIHRVSARRERPMLCMNCAALSGNLMESELFGHERGAFTGADRLRKGRFELADGGTLLLDEISEMALPLQSKFLRVLQEGEFERVGSSITRRANVRVLATTNRNLSDWVAKKRFRADLFYRLNVLPVALPPLRQRREDIPEMVQGFLARIARREGREHLHVTPDALQLMMGYDWPGNIRELENLCERAAAMETEGVIQATTVTPWLQPASSPATMTSLGHLRYGQLLADAERQLVERTLREHGGHRAKTAKALGMGLRTLGMKLKQWRTEDTSSVGVIHDEPVPEIAESTMQESEMLVAAR